jgi:flagellar biosynthetic protein FliR
MMFSLGVLLALPLITALLVTNLALGVLSRVAPALEPVCRRLPVTMALGFLVLC